MDPTEKTEYLIRCKRPSRGLEADYKNSRKSAIDLNCLNCVGLNEKGQTQISLVETCASYDCFFWKFRPGKGSKQPPPRYYPTEDEYESMISKETK